MRIKWSFWFGEAGLEPDFAGRSKWALAQESTDPKLITAPDYPPHDHLCQDCAKKFYPITCSVHGVIRSKDYKNNSAPYPQCPYCETEAETKEHAAEIIDGEIEEGDRVFVAWFCPNCGESGCIACSKCGSTRYKAIHPNYDEPKTTGSSLRGYDYSEGYRLDRDCYVEGVRRDYHFVECQKCRHDLSVAMSCPKCQFQLSFEYQVKDDEFSCFRFLPTTIPLKPLSTYIPTAVKKESRRLAAINQREQQREQALNRRLKAEYARLKRSLKREEKLGSKEHTRAGDGSES